MYTILLADDELIEREYLKSIFKKYPGDYIVIGEASNGEQVIKIANNLKPDIVIMDISMPIINGLEAAKKIKEIFEDTIIILNSAYSEFEFAQKAINYNLDSYLLKPANEKEIIDTIQSSIYKSKDISSSQIRKSQKLETDYPYELIDDLVVSIQAKDLDLLDFSSNTYINYLKKSKTETGDNRIFVINTIFTVMRIMKQSYPEDARCLLRCEGYINDVSQVEYSHKIVSL
ncbi:MAG: response regulator, partial [Tissierellia bacterium]|nr:response regulator [Tissierellia bacterium]